MTARTVAALAGLTVLAPVNALVTLLAWVRGRAIPPPPATGRTVLISGGKMTKALALARSFHAAGHRVVLVEMRRYRFTGHRRSRAVAAFHVVPAPDDPGYAQALLDVVRRERVDVYVPVCSPAASRFDADAKALLEANGCEVVHGDPETIRTVDDKHAFSALAASLGLAVPEHHRITDPQQVADFDWAAHPGRHLLKSIPYDPVRRLDLTPLPRPSPAETAAFARSLPISAQTPFILQRFVAGTEFCTHSTIRDGRVQLHVTCASSAFQVNYEAVSKPAIEAWVRHFAEALSLTGQYSFDFIEAADGRVYAIECNPRTHSAITAFHDHPGVADAYLQSGAEPIQPLPSSRPTYWLYHELWRLVTRPREIARTLRTLAQGTDAILTARDPLPFFAVHHVQIPALLLGNLWARRPWLRVDFNIGKLIEPSGD